MHLTATIVASIRGIQFLRAIFYRYRHTQFLTLDEIIIFRFLLSDKYNAQWKIRLRYFETRVILKKTPVPDKIPKLTVHE